MSSLYNDAPTVSFSLAEFSAHATELNRTGEHDDFVRFVLCGEFNDGNGDRRQAFIDPLRHVVDEDHPLDIARDYDSALGISDKILVNCPINVWAVPHPTQALKTSIHMKRRIMYEGVSLKFVRIEKLTHQTKRLGTPSSRIPPHSEH